MGRRYKIRCRECRRRKVKCTAEQPSCSRCAENGITCPGYDDTKLEFVSYQHRPGVVVAEPLRSHKRLEVSNAITSRQREPPRFQILTSATWPLQSPNGASVNLNQLFSATVTPDAHVLPLVKHGNPTAMWFFNLPGVASNDPLVEHSLQALSLIHLGKTRGDEHAVRMARISFAHALKLLQEAARKKRADFKMLTAAVIISFYELYDCPTVKGDGWARHIEGAQLSGVISGPERLTEVDGVRTWIIFRTLMISNSLCLRKRCLLARVKRPESHIESNSPVLNLCESLDDITALVGEIVEQADQLSLMPWSPETREIYTSILDQWRCLNYQFNLWYSSLHEMVPEPFSGDDSIGSADFDFGPSWTFHSTWVAQTLLLYWAGKLLLYEALRLALKWIQNWPAEESLTMNIEPLPAILSPEVQKTHDALINAALSTDLQLGLALVQQSQYDAARSIRKGIRYVWSSGVGILPQFRAGTPLNVATQYMRSIGDKQEVAYCAKAAKVFEDNQMALGLFIESCAEGWGNTVINKSPGEGRFFKELG